MGFLNALNGGPKPLMGRPSASMLTPEQIEQLLEMGIDPETYLQQQTGFPSDGFDDEGEMPSFELPEMTVYGDAPQPPLTVEDSIEQPMDATLGLETAPSAAPAIGVTPESQQTQGADRDTWYAKLLGGLGDRLGDSSPFSQALMSTGFGILGAQGTGGSTSGALGQGGLAGMRTYERAQRRDSIDKAKKEQLAAQKERAAQGAQLAREKAAADKANKEEQRLGQRATLVLGLRNTDPELATSILAADPALMEYLKVKQGFHFKGKAPTIGEIEGNILLNMSPEEQKAYFLDKKNGSGRAPTRADLAAKALDGDTKAAAVYAEVSGPAGYIGSLMRRAEGQNVLDPAVQAMSPENAKAALARAGKLDAVKSLIGDAVFGGEGGGPADAPDEQAPPAAGVRIRETKPNGATITVKSLPGGKVPDGYELVP